MKLPEEEKIKTLNADSQRISNIVKLLASRQTSCLDPPEDPKYDTQMNGIIKSRNAILMREASYIVEDIGFV